MRIKDGKAKQGRSSVLLVTIDSKLTTMNKALRALEKWSKDVEDGLKIMEGRLLNVSRGNEEEEQQSKRKKDEIGRYMKSTKRVKM